MPYLITSIKKVVPISRGVAFSSSTAVLRNGWGMPVNQPQAACPQTSDASIENSEPVEAA